MALLVEVANTNTERRMPEEVFRNMLPTDKAKVEFDQALRELKMKPLGTRAHVRVSDFPPFIVTWVA
jgi:hypothetical protein